MTKTMILPMQLEQKRTTTVHWREMIPKLGKLIEEEVVICVVVSVRVLEFHTGRRVSG